VLDQLKRAKKRRNKFDSDLSSGINADSDKLEVLPKPQEFEEVKKKMNDQIQMPKKVKQSKQTKFKSNSSSDSSLNENSVFNLDKEKPRPKTREVNVSARKGFTDEDGNDHQPITDVFAS